MGTSAKHDVFQAIAAPTRRQILKLLAEQEMSVTRIAAHFPMSRTAVSKHLRILAEAGLVVERKEGREKRYRLRSEPLLELKEWLSHFEGFWKDRLARLKDFVETDEK
ncbi:DNA-binding transcriptional regulator, ArsR family [Planifilum fulgidum]|jgi:DNA-binding transcriptional ArsR family regulator|uniref:DNA-binding transcriptional regulator, ArsR family n=1 Tax=Planifilum fulgidum TaxID=201973 RepID=A0A1I2Q921_9BACL|nr:metalloregulator ArsR/SmtB family transcription factor [Planifilum fulgidum]MBO2496834.1 ArsR family transcriptional regulator [Bacillota bacterium]MBO2533027.1 ArsR family transcriptional regulator [Thermoactinomycetaceae bacterium]SFG22111.1 DNA-binding transcriptional regulator, ArsR family [Planifilum fulgidum]